MSSTPPPPFGTVPGQGPNPPVYDRRALRAQRQAAATQARWQRDQIRMQMRAARRTSAVGPLLLVAIGIILLLLESGRLRWPDVLGWLGHWWPAILIAAGLLMLAEWALDRQQIANAGTAVVPRRTLGGGTVGILLVLAFIGACVMAAEHGSMWARNNLRHGLDENGFGDWRQFLGVRSDFTEDLQAALSPDGTLTVEDPHGDITVTGSSPDSQVHVTVRQHIYTWQQNEVEDRRRSEQPMLTGNPSHLTLVATTQDQDSADLAIEVPRQTTVTVHSGHGDVTLDELRGAVVLDANRGDVKLTALTGPVDVKAQDDDATITAHSLGAGLTVEGHSGDISASDIEGAVVLRGDFFGTTHLEQIHGPVTFQSSFTRFASAGIPGELNIEGRSDLDAHQLEGPVTLATTDRNLTIDGVRGAVIITDRNGTVNLVLAGPLQPVHVANTNGSVDVAIPPNQGFAVDARTENGEISNEFSLTPEKTGAGSELQAKVAAGGATLRLQTTEGDIAIRRASAAEQAAWTNTPQRLTLSPSTPERHSPATPK